MEYLVKVLECERGGQSEKEGLRRLFKFEMIYPMSNSLSLFLSCSFPERICLLQVREKRNTERERERRKLSSRGWLTPFTHYIYIISYLY